MNGIETRAELPARPSKAISVRSTPMFQASGRCPHCLQHKVARSHFGIRDAEKRLDEMFEACRVVRERQGLTVEG